MAGYIEGWEAQITPGLWKRVETYGVPMYWFGCWVLGSLLQVGGLGIGWLGQSWGYINGVMPILFLCGAELMVLQWGFRTDPHWDTKILLHLWYRWARYNRAR